MNRSKDLDNIAPDDLTNEAETKATSSSKKNKPTNLVIEEPKEISKENPNIDQATDFSNKVYDLLGHSKSSLSPFLVNPKILSFIEQDDGEEIYLALRPHWITNLSWIIVSILMIFLPLFFHLFNFISFIPPTHRFSLILFWYQFAFIYTFEKFLSWYFNLFLVTNQRIVDIDFNNLLNKHFAEANLNMIQDTSSSVRGVFGTFFDYGDVLIQTAAEINQIKFENISNPGKVIRILKELRDLKSDKTGGNQ